VRKLERDLSVRFPMSSKERMVSWRNCPELFGEVRTEIRGHRLLLSIKLGRCRLGHKQAQRNLPDGAAGSSSGVGGLGVVIIVLEGLVLNQTGPRS
jgi:hypothetical protein